MATATKEIIADCSGKPQKINIVLKVEKKRKPKEEPVCNEATLNPPQASPPNCQTLPCGCVVIYDNPCCNCRCCCRAQQQQLSVPPGPVFQSPSEVKQSRSKPKHSSGKKRHKSSRQRLSDTTSAASQTVATSIPRTKKTGAAVAATSKTRIRQTKEISVQTSKYQHVQASGGVTSKASVTTTRHCKSTFSTANNASPSAKPQSTSSSSKNNTGTTGSTGNTTPNTLAREQEVIETYRKTEPDSGSTEGPSSPSEKDLKSLETNEAATYSKDRSAQTYENESVPAGGVLPSTTSITHGNLSNREKTNNDTSTLSSSRVPSNAAAAASSSVNQKGKSSPSSGSGFPSRSQSNKNTTETQSNSETNENKDTAEQEGKTLEDFQANKVQYTVLQSNEETSASGGMEEYYKDIPPPIPKEISDAILSGDLAAAETNETNERSTESTELNRTGGGGAGGAEAEGSYYYDDGGEEASSEAWARTQETQEAEGEDNELIDSMQPDGIETETLPTFNFADGSASVRRIIGDVEEGYEDSQRNTNEGSRKSVNLGYGDPNSEDSQTQSMRNQKSVYNFVMEDTEDEGGEGKGDDSYIAEVEDILQVQETITEEVEGEECCEEAEEGGVEEMEEDENEEEEEECQPCDEEEDECPACDATRPILSYDTEICEAEDVRDLGFFGGFGWDSWDRFVALLSGEPYPDPCTYRCGGEPCGDGPLPVIGQQEGFGGNSSGGGLLFQDDPYNQDSYILLVALPLVLLGLMASFRGCGCGC